MPSSLRRLVRSMRTRALWLASAAFALAAPDAAGTGTIANGKLNLLVYFAYDETDPAAWEPVFTEYSRLLLNATEGGLQLGTVRFTVCPDFQDEADVWVLNDFSGARAHLFGLGVPGLHITISQTHKSISGGAIGQFGLAHESGHYIWGCYDEYRGFVGNEVQSSVLHNCTIDPSTVACLMDGGTTVFPNNTRTEFCTSQATAFPGTVHNAGVMGISGMGVLVAHKTDQEYYLGRSCWEQIQISGRGGLVHPSSEPPQAVPPHTPVVFDVARFQGDLAVAIVLDRSGSMSAEGRLENAVLGAKNGVGLLEDGEGLSIVAFADVPQVIFLSSSMTDASKAAANAALDGVVAGGGTGLGLAVQTAIDQLAGMSGCVEPIIVITDGISADPQIDDPTILAALAAGEHAVFTVAVGSFADVTALNAVSTATGGQFFSVASSSELPGVLATIFATAGYGTPVFESFEAEPLAGSDRTHDFEVGEGVAALRVDLSFAAGADLGLSVLAPDGTLIAFDAPPSGTTAFESSVQKALTIANPDAGTWTATVDESMGIARSFDLLVYVESVALDVSTKAFASEVSYPAPMQVSVGLVAGVPVGDATVTGVVERPDGSSVPVAFFDDGLTVHGDLKADDGIYGTLFTRYVGDGAYAFRMSIDGSNVAAASNQECGIYGRGTGEDGQQAFAIAPFTACASHTVVLIGQTTSPSVGHASLDALDSFAPISTIDLDRVAVALAAFELDVAPNEPLILEQVTLDVRRPGDEPIAAERIALHLDRNSDGEVDVPSVPLALGTLSTDGTELVFANPGGQLTFLTAGSRHAFLFTAGDGLDPQLERAAFGGSARAPSDSTGAAGSDRSPGAGGTLSPGSPRPASGASSGVLLPGAAVLGVLVLFVLGLRRGVARSRRVAAGWLGTTAALALVVVTFPGCSHGRDQRVLELRASPAGIQLQGAVTGVAASVDGPAQTFRARLR